MKIKIEFEISDAAFELLKRLEKVYSLEYRDPEYKSLDDYRKYKTLTGITPDNSDEERFLKRNSGGTFYLMEELLGHDLVDFESKSWHQTFILSDLGKKVLQINT